MKIILIILILFLINLVDSSHFRGGIVTWKPINSTLSESAQTIRIALTKRFYWRKQSECKSDGTTLVGLGEGYILFGNKSMTTDVYCNEVSIIDNWYGGEKIDYVDFSFAGSSKYVEGLFESCCWISTIVNGPDSGWKVRVKLNMTRRQDQNVINSSPIALIEPIKTLPVNCQHLIKIDVADINNDIIKCRWAILAKNECVGLTCGPIQGITLDQNKCELSVNLNVVGPYAILLQIEDYATASSTIPLSSVPLQFIINATNSKCIPQNSTILPTVSQIKFHEDTQPPKDACVGLEPNKSFSENIVVFSSSLVKEIVVQGPSGIISSQIKPYGNNSSLYYITLNWTPNQSQIGYHLFNLKATNQDGVSTTESYSFKVVVGAGSPILNDPFPKYHVKQNNGYSFRLKSNIPVKNTNRSSLIKIFEKNTNLLVDQIESNKVIIDNQLLSFNSYFSFKLNTVYYITIEEGLVSSLEYCGVDSAKIESVSFWNFIVLNDFNGFLNYEYLQAFGYSNDSIEIDLAYKNITYIEPNTFSGMFQLFSLNLTSNYLDSISFLSLNNLNTLKDLYIDKNKLNNLDPNDFDELKNLARLSLADNNLISINFSLLLPNLQCLYLNNNYLTKINLNLFKNLSNLKCLYLNNNKLKSINSDDFSNLFNLNYLNLESNNLIDFDRQSLLSIKSLRTVCLKNNPVVDLFPTSFKQICMTSPNCIPRIVDWCLE